MLLRMSFASSLNHKIELVWTLENYVEFFSNSDLRAAAAAQPVISALITVITVAIGFPAAWYIARAPKESATCCSCCWSFRGGRSYIVRVFAWYTVFGNNGVINRTLTLLGIISDPLPFFTFDLPALVITEINLYLPLTNHPIYMVLERLDWNLVLSAAQPRCSRWYVFRRIVWPLSLPGVIAGAVFVFMPVAGTFVVPDLVGGTGGIMFGKIVASQFGEAFHWAFGSGARVILLSCSCFAPRAADRRRATAWPGSSTDEPRHRLDRTDLPVLVYGFLFFPALLS
jgi:ABC-type spermidine/putrescine transport system permease subunit I